MYNDEAFGTLEWVLFDKSLLQSNFTHIRRLPEQTFSLILSLCVMLNVNNCYKVFYFL